MSRDGRTGPEMRSFFCGLFAMEGKGKPENLRPFGVFFPSIAGRAAVLLNRRETSGEWEWASRGHPLFWDDRESTCRLSLDGPWKKKRVERRGGGGRA
ncbi:R-LORF5 protein [Gallid alphaherpesvirus 3]|uniref:R-LORF5 protein n=1 Tax=Gallid alphaherpesvirus 3 TaxID=35250 RepID=F8TBY1_9ALPH|nr:R-LORF5 protein [Gallid alphaherpesvirus 3]AEI00192.1 R-LORF5 protein [Gallid alphaherpesvirus 3]